MSFARLIIAGLSYHRRAHGAVLLGVVAATAVLSGALVIGDSVRGSLARLALDRLQKIDEVLVVPRFFRRDLVSELEHAPQFAERFTAAVPAVYVEGTVEEPDAHRRAAHVNVLGIDEHFPLLARAGSPHIEAPAAGEICLNQPLADELGATVGGEVLLRLPIAREVPADSALGRKTETLTNLRLKVKQIVPAAGLGHFALRPSQAEPRDALVNLDEIGRAMQQAGKVNAIFVAGQQGSATPALLAADHAALEKEFHPTLADYGLSIRAVPAGYFVVESDRLLLEPAAAAAAEASFGPLGAQPVYTYLANTLADLDRSMPYSTVAAIDFTAELPLGGFRTTDGAVIAPLTDDEIALNAWAAEQLDAKVGDTISMTFFEPESTHGEARERTVALRLAAIVPLEGPAADPDLTPTLPGVTDKLSIADWNPPFPFDAQRIGPRDEEYWDRYRATPKAFVSLALGRSLWRSRFGDTTSLRIPPAEGRSVESLTARFAPDPKEMGFAFQPVKLQALQAAAGTTPFEGLFLGFSFFIIAAALMLIAILFRLGVDSRAAEIGVLSATGFSAARCRRLLLGEGLCVAVAGATLGSIVGIGYAWLMLAGLRTWWVAAIGTPFLQLAVRPQTVLIGIVAGVAVCVAVIYWSSRRLRRYTVRALLAGQVEEAPAAAKSPRRARWLSAAALLAALALAALGTRSAEAAALAFFGAGALVLTALLALLTALLRGSAGGRLTVGGRAPLMWMALRNAARNPRRSTLSMGLIAAASFLITSISTFRIDPQTGADRRTSGTGGFALVAESDQPIFQNLNTAAGRDELGFSSADEPGLQGTHVDALRATGGEDASCLNLYQTRQPRVLSVSPALVERGAFTFSQSAATTPAERANPWLLLNRELPPHSAGTRAPAPVVLDEATAKYALHLGGVGSTYTITDGRGEAFTLEVVGLLQNSVLQGTLLVGERDFLQHFPDTSGYRVFLIDAPAADAARVSDILERTLGEFGFDAEPAPARLAAFAAVQNTYLSTFQSLGGLGLLLGTCGLAAVQLRNVFERRSELALLQAEGFRRALIARIVLWENILLLAGGLAIGCVAAGVALFPHFVAGGARLPIVSLAATLALVLGVGLLAGMSAVRAALAAPVVPALRGE